MTLKGRVLSEILSETHHWYRSEITNEQLILDQRIQEVENRMNAIQDRIQYEKERWSTIDAVKTRTIEKKDAVKHVIQVLTDQYTVLLDELNDANKNFVQDRVHQIEKELQLLVDMYNSTFEHKLGSQGELKKANAQHIEICSNLIDETKKTFDATNTILREEKIFGFSNYSAMFLISTGGLAAIAAGWFFSIFAEQNQLSNENWLFFTLTNLFNYLGQYAYVYGKLKAVGILIGLSVIVLLVISLIAWICEAVLHRVSRDRSDIDIGINYTPKNGNYFRFSVKTNSFMAFWLQVLPWIFTIIILTIIVAVGQTNEANSADTLTHQMSKLGEHLSSYIIGSTIAFIFVGLFFLYLINVVEPRKRKRSEESGKKENLSQKKVNKELILLTLIANISLVILLVGQLIGGNFQGKSLVPIFCFVLLVNLTAVTLGYGIRHVGLNKTVEAASKKIIALSNYRKALSGDKPIHLWIHEERQFGKYYLLIQKELFQIIQSRSMLSKRWEKSLKKYSEYPAQEEKIPSDKKKWSMNRAQRSMRASMNFYRQHFPKISFQLENVRGQLRAERKHKEKLTQELVELNEERHPLQIAIKKEIDELATDTETLKESRFDLLKLRVNVQRNLEKEKILIEKYIAEGNHLGEWMIEHQRNEQA